jgi:hypothetical protein
MRLLLTIPFLIALAGCDGKLYTMQFDRTVDLHAALETIVAETNAVAREHGFNIPPADHLTDLATPPLAAWEHVGDPTAGRGYIRVLVLEPAPGKLSISMLCFPAFDYRPAKAFRAGLIQRLRDRLGERAVRSF